MSTWLIKALVMRAVYEIPGGVLVGIEHKSQVSMTGENFAR